ncbi:hypothetical protein [Lactobacillus intestinalis]|uniref:hypothetical protein n=1 Tax=Lactobacillus intestinalis TaxID=151781 RepID=UPI001F561282|nr:hypothetical protein [Lactobacillus intestinalis]
MQLYKKSLKANSTLIISSILAVQNSKFKTMSIEQLQSLNIENGNFGTLGKTVEMMVNTPDFDYNQPVETAMELSASIDNATGIENGITIDGIVLVTNDPFSGDIIPFAVSKAIDPEIIPPKRDDDITYTFSADLLLNVDRTDKISVKYSPNGLVKRKDLEKHEEEADDKYARKIDTYTKIETNNAIENAKPKKLKWGIELNGGYLNNAGDPQGEFNFGYDKDALYLNPKKILESITYSLAKDDYLLVSHAQLTQALKEYKAVKKISGLNPDSIGNVNLDGKYLSKTDPSVVKFGNIGDLEFKKGAVSPNGPVGQFETLYYKNDGNTTFLANVDMLNAVSATKVNKSTLSEELDKKADKTDLDKKMDLKLIRIDSSNAEKYGLNRDLIYKAAKEGRYDFASTVISEPLRLPEEVKSVPFYLQITNFNTFQEQVIVASNNFVPTIYRRFIENNTANKRTWYKFTGIPVEK